MEHKRENESIKEIKFGIICSGSNLLSWHVKCLNEILSLENVYFSLLIIEGDKQTISPNIPTKNYWNFSKSFLYQAYKSLIPLHKSERPENIDEIIKDVPIMKCNVLNRGENYYYFTQEDIKTIKKFDLDFILYFGFKNIRGDILNAARYGIWAFHYGDKLKYRGGPSCFWEIFRKDPITKVSLYRITDDEVGIILKEGYLKTKIFHPRNVDQVYQSSFIWPSQVIIDIRNVNSQYFDIQSPSVNAPFYGDPTNIQMINYFFTLFTLNVYNYFKKLLVRNQWNIGLSYKSIQSFLVENTDFVIHWLPQMKSEMLVADPFAIKREDKTYIFCEKLNQKINKGEIATFILNGTDSSINFMKLNLNVSCHLSYPYLFEYNNDMFLIPESSEIESISLYRSLAFPEKWEKISTILDNVKAVDTTVFQHEGMWWLFYTDNNFGMDNNLFILYSSDPLGEWNQHDLNPVKIDIRSSRCAGTPFIHENILYRPSQDCSEKYGGKIAINKVVKLTPHEFEEKVVSIIEPSKDSPYPEGRHTISSCGDITVFDGCKLVFIWDIFYMKLIASILRR